MPPLCQTITSISVVFFGIREANVTEVLMSNYTWACYAGRQYGVPVTQPT